MSETKRTSHISFSKIRYSKTLGFINNFLKLFPNFVSSMNKISSSPSFNSASMASSTASSSVPPVSLHIFRLRKNKSCQSLKLWPSSVCDIKISRCIEHFRGFSLSRALGTSSSLSSSETENVRRSKKTSDRGSRNADGFERELQELFGEVKSMIALGNRDEARDLLEANYEASKEMIDRGEKSIEIAAFLDVIALGYAALGDPKIVESLLDTLTEIVKSITDDEQLLDPILVHMASMFSNLGKFEESVLVYQRAIDIMDNKYGKNSVFLVTPYLGVAKCLGSTGKAKKAIEFYNSAILILESSRGTECEELIMPLFGLGNLLLKEQKAKDAETPFLRIVNLYAKLYGKNDGRVGMAMCSLARVKCVTGDSDNAIRLYREALQTIKDSNYMAMDDPVLEKMRVDFAQLLHLVGRGKEGREILEECLVIAEKSRGKEHPSSVTHMVSLAASHLRSKNYAEAEHLLRNSLQIMRKTTSSDDQAVSFPMLHLAVTLFHLKRDEEAEQLAFEALRIREKAFGEESLPVAEVLDCLVSIQNRLGNDNETLLGQLKRVLRIQEKYLGNESEEVLETLKKMAFYLDKLGRKDEKLSLQRRLSMLRMKFKQRIPY